MLSLDVQDCAAPLSGHLPMGTPPGDERRISVDSRVIHRNGRPWLPVMGEFHFSRYPASEWRAELTKMQAGGIDVVATYLFWNHHEPERGEYRFDASRDIGEFVRIAGELGLCVAVRLGPWAHGECRNGGFPDWLADVDCVPRTDDPAYLALVEPYYQRIGRELAGLTWAEGGPIVAVQVENELYDQPDHLATLRALAKQAGIHAPLWTATAWGGARLPADLVLPLYGGYPEAFWENAGDGWARGMRKHYFFTEIRDDHAIGADLRPTALDTSDQDPPDDRRYPYATCELGGGMAIAYHRRPLVRAEDISALALTKLGSGSVWQGYYLYHGCSQRLDLPTTNQESHATGYPNDLPTVTYDFQAPLGEFGQVRPSFHALRSQHFFLRDCGAELAELPVHLPEQPPEGLDDQQTLRWSVRAAADRGFLFINNHQPHETLPDHHDVQFAVTLADTTVRLPAAPVTIPTGTHCVWPIGYRLAGGRRLAWASAQPLARLTIDGVPTSVFVASDGIPAQFAFAESVTLEGVRVASTDSGPVRVVDNPGTDARFTLFGPDGAREHVLVLDEAAARRLYQVDVAGSTRLVLSDDLVVASGSNLHVEGTSQTGTVALLPAPAEVAGAQRAGSDGVFVRWRFATPEEPPEPQVAALNGEPRSAAPRTGGPFSRASAPTDQDYEHAARFRVSVDARAFDEAAEVLLRLSYIGDAARAYLDGQLIADHFWFGPEWEIGLRRFAAEVVEHGIEIRILPRDPANRVYVDPSVRPDFGVDGAAEIRHAQLRRVHRVGLRLSAGDSDV